MWRSSRRCYCGYEVSSQSESDSECVIHDEDFGLSESEGGGQFFSPYTGHALHFVCSTEVEPPFSK